MKNYLKNSIFSLIIICISTVFISCENETFNENEEFAVDAGQKAGVSEKLIALYSTRHGTYISSENGGNVTCNKREIGAFETITMVTWEDGTVSFKGNNGLFLSDENGAETIRFNRKKAGLWEKFQLIHAHGGGTVNIIRAGQNDGDKLSYLNGSATDVNFNIDNGGVYRDFSIIDIDSQDIVTEKLIALYSNRNGTYISSENGGDVTCYKREIGAFETITMVSWGDGTVSFKGNNGLFLSDENGANNIRFNRKKAGLWEKFQLIHALGGGTVSIIRAGQNDGDKLSYLNGANTEVNFNIDNGGVYRDFLIIDL